MSAMRCLRAWNETIARPNQRTRSLPVLKRELQGADLWRRPIRHIGGRRQAGIGAGYRPELLPPLRSRHSREARRCRTRFFQIVVSCRDFGPRVTVTPGALVGTSTCGEAASGASGHQHEVGATDRFDVRLSAIEHDAAVAGDRCSRDRGRVPLPVGLREGPRRNCSVPSSRPGSTAACCSSEPAEARAEATRFTGRNGPGATRRPISSATMAASAVDWPERLPPPRVSGTNSEVQPSSAVRWPPLSIKALGRRVQVTNHRQRGFALQE